MKVKNIQQTYSLSRSLNILRSSGIFEISFTSRYLYNDRKEKYQYRDFNSKYKYLSYLYKRHLKIPVLLIQKAFKNTVLLIKKTLKNILNRKWF